ncbi:hypothetical protein [Asanoa iriomotensis]|uniref:DUF4179 domain-containing protein n=1 Tax=Asanoa iriomotensis TaxID=234613 RepID=A0ABQ4BZN8_9ACTN|nr:hypothetical protein [Asanoa iriomotensis]GIF55971.1 hypothetical protein Air01nite_20660 [Asanoa iriomotensis]
MRDIQDLRRALHEESAVVPSHIDLAAVRRRGHHLQRRRHVVTATALLAAVALAVPVASALIESGSTGGQVVASSPGAGPDFLGGGVETGAVLRATDGREYDIVLGFLGTRDDAMFTVAFRDSATSSVVPWDMVSLPRAPDGDIAGKRPGDPSHRFYSAQLLLEPGRLLDLGIFSGPARGITVASEGKTSDATVAVNSATGWTLFWVVRDAKPLPPEAYTTERGYTGPESITVTAYGADGTAAGTATSSGAARADLSRIGGGVQNPRDHEPADDNPAPNASFAATPD